MNKLQHRVYKNWILLVECLSLTTEFCVALREKGLINKSQHEKLNKFLKDGLNVEGAEYLLTSVVNQLSQASEDKFIEALRHGNNEKAIELLRPSASGILEGEKILFGCKPKFEDQSFYGRAEELEQLQMFLKSNKHLALISGLGGSGKSSLAKALAQEENKHRHCIILKAENSSSLQNDILELRKLHGMETELHAPLLCLPLPTLNSRNAKNVLLQVIQRIQNKNPAEILVVFDNVRDSKVQAKIQPIISSLLSYKYIHICITSRVSNLINGRDIFYLPPLSNLDAIGAHELVHSYLPDESQCNITKLCQRLNYFPLALVQAVDYIIYWNNDSLVGFRYTINNFIEDMNENPKSVLEKNCNTFDFQTLFKIWDINFKDFKRRPRKYSRMIERILETMSYINPDGIRLEDLSQLIFGKNEIGHMRTRLLKKCLLSLKRVGFIKSEDQVISIDRLVQEVVRMKNKNLGSTIERLACNALQFMQCKNNKPDSRKLVHIKSIWNTISASFNHQVSYGKIAKKMCQWMFELHEYVSGGKFSQKAIEFLVLNSSEELAAIDDLEFFVDLSYYLQNDHITAAEMFMKSKSRGKLVHRNLKMLSMVMTELQDFNKAIFYGKEYRNYARNTSGKEDESRRAQKRLAHNYYWNGDVERASKYFENVHEKIVLNWKSGGNPTDRVEVLTSLVVCLEMLNQNKRKSDILSYAENLVRKNADGNLEKFISINVANDPDYFLRGDFFTQVFRNLKEFYSIISNGTKEDQVAKHLAKASLNFSLGNLEGCTKYLEKAKQALPKDIAAHQYCFHINWLQCQVYIAKEEYETARHCSKIFETDCDQVYGPLSEYRCKAKTELLKLLLRFEEPQLQNMLREEYSYRKKHLGVAHHLTFEVLELKVNAMHKFGNPQLALETIHMAKKEMETFFGKKNFVTINRTIMLLRLYRGIGMISEGLDLVEEIQDFGKLPNHKVMLLKYSTAQLYECIGMLKEAVLLAEEAYKLAGNMYSEGHRKHIMVARYYARLLNIVENRKGACYILQNLENVLWQDTLFITEDISWIKQSLAIVKMQMGETEEAFKLLEQVYDWRCKQLTANHTKSMSVKFRIGWLHQQLGNLNKAKEIYEEVLKVDTETENNFSRANLSRRYHYAMLLNELGEFKVAFDILEEAIPHQRKSFGEEHFKTKRMEDKVLCLETETTEEECLR